MLKIKRAGVGFYLLILSLVFGILGFIYYQSTYSIFKYANDRLSIVMTIVSLWLMAFLIIDTLFTGENPPFGKTFYAISIFMLTYALLRLLTPCLSPIGIYLTVNNMGDVETNAIAVPKCFLATGFYGASIIFLLAGGIFGTTRRLRVKKSAENVDDIDSLFTTETEDSTKTEVANDNINNGENIETTVNIDNQDSQSHKAEGEE